MHFALVGLVLFAVAPPERDGGGRTARVDRGRIERALREEQARRGRVLAAAEKQAVMADLVTEELLYREGLRLGVGADDPEVRARIAERMRAQLEAAAPPPPTADDELRAEIASLAERAPERARLRTLFVSKDRPDAARLADALARELANAPGGRAPTSPDRPSLTDAQELTADEIARIAGAAVAKAAQETPVGRWSSPIASSWGFYLVLPVERRRARPEELREAALFALRRRKQGDVVRRMLERSARDTRLVVEVPEGEPPFDPHAARATGTTEGID